MAIFEFVPRGETMAVGRRPSERLRFGVFQLDPTTGELLRAGRQVRLQEQPFKILMLLLERPGELVTRDDLRQQLWPADTFVDFDDGVNAAVKKLRFALGDSSENPRFIETIPRRGYRFIAPVANVVDAVSEWAAAESAASSRHARFLASGNAMAVGLAMIATVAVAAVTLINTNAPAPKSSDLSAIRSLVVLPLKNLSNDPAQQYFADGMTEELTTRIASLGGLRVISRTSSMQYRETRKLLPQIASELHVDAVVEGSVLRSEGRVRITARLVHGHADRQLWAESYDRDERDVLKLQNEVARDIAHNVSLSVRSASAERTPVARTVHPDAHQSYLKGRYRWHTRRWDELQSAIGDFQRAISIEPDYALAYAGLADCYLVLPLLGGVTQEEAYPKAKEAAEKALALDPGLAEAHNSNAYVKLYLDWDFAGAERGFRKAIELNPSYATAHQWYAELLSFEGRREEAIAEMRTALDLDPLSAVMHHQAGQTYQQARQYDQAIQEYQNAIALDPQFTGPSSMFMSFAYWRKGLLELAAEKMGLVFRNHAEAAKAASGLAQRSAVGNMREYNRKQLEVARFFPRPAYYFGLFHAALGDDAQAFHWLEKAYERRDECILYIKVDPEWDRLRSDERFVAIVRRVGLPVM
jgi:TolB-like protein/DNA-binding winged helix-turn-helix (wHTH) protein/tetratricopeptide (TPR) repeat protein